MENFTLNTIVNYSKKSGFKRIIGEYIPTEKNKMVENHYQNLGFFPIYENSQHLFALDIDSYVTKECYIIAK
jgi:predicted enzyme involved in methoxymalonyl-ACP biosynthesis